METIEKEATTEIARPKVSCRMCGLEQSHNLLQHRWEKTNPKDSIRVLCDCSFKYGISRDDEGNFTAFDFVKNKSLRDGMYMKKENPEKEDKEVMKSMVGTVKSVVYLRIDKTEYSKLRVYSYTLEEYPDKVMEARHKKNSLPIGSLALFELRYINSVGTLVGTICKHSKDITNIKEVINKETIDEVKEVKADEVVEVIEVVDVIEKEPVNTAPLKEVINVDTSALRVTSLSLASSIYGINTPEDVMAAADKYYNWLTTC